MPGERKRFYILPQQISENRAWIYALDFGHENIRKTLRYKKLNLVGCVVQSKVYDPTFYKCKYFTHPASFTLVRYDKVFESKEAKGIQDNWSIFEKSST